MWIGAKTDRADAALIADVMRFGRVTPWTPPDPRYAALQVLTRHRRQLSHLITQEKIARWCNCFVSGGSMPIRRSRFSRTSLG
ncbi:IS110 family transposase [Sulfobacillus thermosulfidooxidans]|uniref:IS110 family transposase n=1 Tax=Sulfobacillus thermosulfidooxidans TaxID=28034 RepID=UPI0002E76306